MIYLFFLILSNANVDNIMLKIFTEIESDWLMYTSLIHCESPHFLFSMYQITCLNRIRAQEF